MKDARQVKQIIGTQFWAGAQDDIPAFLQVNPSIRSVICLRRDLPEWWTKLKQTSPPYRYFLHTPLPSIKDAGLERALLTVLNSEFPNIARPAVFFCLKGCNRTGILAGLLRFDVTYSLSDAEKEYRSRAGISFRHNECKLLERMCGFRMLEQHSPKSSPTNKNQH
jgi:hypothetical protein